MSPHTTEAAALKQDMLIAAVDARSDPLLALDIGEALHRSRDEQLRVFAATLLRNVPVEFQVPRWRRCMSWLPNAAVGTDRALFIDEGPERSEPDFHT